MTLHEIPGYIQSIYLAENPEGLLLLDGCCRVDVDTVCDFIVHTLQRPLTDLKLTVVTHMHPDHAGGAHRLRKKTGCQIATGAAPGQWYQGGSGRLMHLTDVVLGMYMANRMGRPMKNLWYSRTLKPDFVLDDGERLPGFGDWQVVTTHGHTDRDISLLHLPSRRLYVADLIVKVRNRFITPWPLFHPNRYRASVERVKAMPLHSILLAHGGEIEVTPEHPCFSVHTPKMPRTHWRATKYRIRRLMQRSAARG